MKRRSKRNTAMLRSFCLTAMAAGLIAFILGGCGRRRQPPKNSEVEVVFTSGKVARTLAQAVQNPYRSKENRRRDAYLHPEDTLALFGVQRGWTVVVAEDGTRYWPEILAPYLRSEGKLLVTVLDAKQTKIPERSPELALLFDQLDDAEMRGQLGDVFKGLAKRLRRGDRLGIVQARAARGSNNDREVVSLGYLTQESVVEGAEKAGFQLVAQSEVNANPYDKRQGSESSEADKGTAFGEPDRMTLLFRKR